jgi:hypothetical protein
MSELRYCEFRFQLAFLHNQANFATWMHPICILIRYYQCNSLFWSMRAANTVLLRPARGRLAVNIAWYQTLPCEAVRSRTASSMDMRTDGWMPPVIRSSVEASNNFTLWVVLADVCQRPMAIRALEFRSPSLSHGSGHLILLLSVSL